MTLKNEKIILGLGLIAGVAGLTQGVSADEVKESSSQETRVENAQVSEADLRSAEAQLDATANALNSAVRAEQEARANIARAENTVSEAQAEVAKVEEIAKTATPENIEKAKTEIANQEKAIASQNDVVANKTAEQDSAKTAEKAQEAEVNKASAVTAEKEKAVSKADEAVKTAEDVLNGTGLDKAREAQTKAVQEEAEAKSSLALAKETLERAEADAKNREQAIQNAQTAVFKAQASVDEAGAEVTTARQDVERANSDHNTALATLNRAQDAVQSQNKIAVPTAFVEAVKKYIEVDNGDKLAPTWLSDVTSAGRAILAVNTAIANNPDNVYKPTTSDKSDTTIYNVNNLPEAVKEDLALFGAELVNQIRRELGISEYVVTKSSQDFAYKVAKEYINGNYGQAEGDAMRANGGHAHYAKGINNVARKYGFSTTSETDEAKGAQKYENRAYTGGTYSYGDFSNYRKNATISELKHEIYESIKSFIGTQGDLAHLASVLGLDQSQNDTQKYLGISVGHSKDVFNVHFINGLTEQEVAKNANFDTTALANPYDSKQAEQALKDARNQVGQTKAVKDDAESKLNTAVSNQATAQAVLRSAESVLAEVSSGADRVTPAKETLARAEVRYNTAVSTLATANATVSALTASVAEKEKALEGAKEALATVQKELSLAQSNEATEVAKLKVLTERVASATTAVETETKALETLRNQLAEMKTNLDIMENAPARLTDAKARVAVAEKTLEEAKAVLDKAVSELEDAKAKNAVAEAHHAKVLEAYKAYMNAKQEAIRQAQIKAEYDRLVRQGVTPIPVVNERGEVVGYQAPQVESQKAPVLTPVQKEVSQYTNQSLPKTGSQEGGFLAMLGLTLSTFGIAGFKKKIRRE